MRIALVLIVVMGHKGSKLSKPKGTPPMEIEIAAAQTCPAVKLEPPDHQAFLSLTERTMTKHYPIILNESIDFLLKLS